MLNECAEYFSVALLTEAMIDSEGNLKDYDQWVKDTASINAHYNKAWLRTEYDTAVLRAQMAADWKQFETDADVLPNLKWMPTTSVTPREQHRVFWSEGLTLPIDDPFWNKHRPGDLWNCKCWLEQTDEPATAKKDLPKESEMPSPMPGLEGNPAKTEEIFSQDHPHFPTSCASCLLNTDGKVHGTVNKVNNVKRKDAKGNCAICDVYEACQKRISSIGDPVKNPNLKPVDGYEKTIFTHIRCDENDLDRNLQTAKDIIDYGFKDIKRIIINHHILEDGLSNPEYTFVFSDGRKVYADRKGITGKKGVKSSFLSALEQCDRIVVIDTRHIAIIDPQDYADQLYGRINDFKSDRIEECFITRGEKVFRFDKEFMLNGDKDAVKNLIRNFLVEVKVIEAEPLPKN